MQNLLLNWEDLTTGKALKDLKKTFARAGSFVVSAETDGKVKKSSGIDYKTLDLSFGDNQKVSLDVKKDGDIFAVRINGSVLPIKNHDEKAVIEVINALDKTRAKFQAKQARIKIELPLGMKSTTKRQTEVIQDRIIQIDNEIVEAIAQRDALKAELASGNIVDSVIFSAKGLSLVEIPNGEYKGFQSGCEIKISKGDNTLPENMSMVTFSVDRTIRGLNVPVTVMIENNIATVDIFEESHSNEYAQEKTSDVVILDDANKEITDSETALDSIKESTFSVHGRKFKTKVFTTVDAANNFMKKNENYGVIGENGKEGDKDYEVHVALKSDNGKSFDNTETALDSVIEATNGEDGNDWYTTTYRGSQYAATRKKDGTWEVWITRLSLSRHVPSFKFYNTIEELVANQKGFVGLDKMLSMDDKKALDSADTDLDVIKLAVDNAEKYLNKEDKLTAFDSVGLSSAVEILRQAKQACETNYPINIERGDTAQAELEQSNITQFDAAIVLLDSANWSAKVETEWTPPEGFFTQSAGDIASGLSHLSDDLQQAMARLNFYINRAGSNLSEEDKARLESAKEQLSALFDSVEKDSKPKENDETVLDSINEPECDGIFIHPYRTNKQIE